MSFDINYCNFSGRLTRNPEMSFTPQGTPVTKMTLAQNYWDGKAEVSQFINLVVWGKQAETCDKWLKTGSQIFVGAEMRMRKYTDKNGVEKYWTDFNVKQLSFGVGTVGKDEAKAYDSPEPVDISDDPGRPF